MSFGGTVSAMISSLKSNNSLRRKKETFSKFHKKPIALDSWNNPLSREENLLIIEENKKILKKNTKIKIIFGVFIILLYGSIITTATLILIG